MLREIDRATLRRFGVPDYRGPSLIERIRINTAAQWEQRTAAETEVEHWRAVAARVQVVGGEPDSALRALADRRAELLAGLVASEAAKLQGAALLSWLNGEVEALQGRPFVLLATKRPIDSQVRGFVERASCRLWWRRQLRRACVRATERRAHSAGAVHKRARAPYITDETHERMRQRAASNAAVLAATKLENDAGQVLTVAELAAVSTANPALRRGELMTRITGCEKLADLCDTKGLFVTLTAPSRFHRRHITGEHNAQALEAIKRGEDVTPRAAQAWLSEAWARARSKIQRRGILCFGFRVAEPHHCGCPHWHLLLWCEQQHAAELSSILRAAWLKFDGDERGADRHRCKVKIMDRGGASGYIAKYIAKGIDDEGAVGGEGHLDDGSETDQQGELFGGNAGRVRAWASAWGIRQFQPLGQPPVTVWRELRRVPEQGRAGLSMRMDDAFAACNKAPGRKADWARYVVAQGGVCTGRRYAIRIKTETRERAGRYEMAERECPIGVIDTADPGRVFVSARREWRAAGSWSKADREPVRAGSGRRPLGPPWTRVNNCTHVTLVNGQALPRGAPLRTWFEVAQEEEAREREAVRSRADGGQCLGAFPHELVDTGDRHRRRQPIPRPGRHRAPDG